MLTKSPLVLNRKNGKSVQSGTENLKKWSGATNLQSAMEQDPRSALCATLLPQLVPEGI